MQVHPKVTAAASGSGVAGAIVVILVYILSLKNINVPTDVSAAMIVVVSAIGAFIGGYLIPGPKSPPAAAPTPQNGQS